MEMKKKVSILIAFPLIIAASLSGCTNVRFVPFRDNTYVNDFTDNANKKGYVEFYGGGSSNLMIAKVYKLTENASGRTEMLMGLIGQHNGKTRVLAAEKPGSYTYLVEKNTSASTVNIRVVENMLTRVGVSIQKLCREKIRNRRGEKVMVDFFDIHMTPEPPVPFSKKFRR
jgi:hypothetical protein